MSKVSEELIGTLWRPYSEELIGTPQILTSREARKTEWNFPEIYSNKKPDELVFFFGNLIVKISEEPFGYSF